MRLKHAFLLLVLAASAGCFGTRGSKEQAASPQADSSKKQPYAVLTTSRGVIVVRLLPLQAPKAVANFTELALGKKSWTDPADGKLTDRPLYKGTVFFRVIPGFMIQGGDPSNTGAQGPGYQFEDDLNAGRNFDTAGAVAMANAGPNTNGSQFFITLAPAPWLNGKNTVFGEVTQGLDIAQAIASAPRTVRDPETKKLIDRPKEPVLLQDVRIEER